MISGTGLLLAFLGFALLAVAAAIVWWINRTPSAFRRSGQSELPLFSVSLTESRYSPVKPQAAVPASRSSNGRSERRDTAGKATTSAERGDLVERSADHGVSARPSPAGSAGSAGSAASVSATAVTPPTGSSAPPTASSAASSAPPSTRTPSRQRATDGSTTSAVTPSPPPSLGRPANFTVPLVPESSTAVSEDGVPGTQVEGHLLRFAVPQEGTLQFLPGRLEILNGLDAGREVRFVRAPGPDGLQVTFGRAEGPAYRHVQLREGTVSRSHARMAMRDGAWYLTNLSSTNPVVHNEHILSPNEERLLADGDRVEMGEVVFGFRSR